MTAGRTPDRFATDPRAPGDLFAGGGTMGNLMRSVDWGATSLGPIEAWPQSLRSVLASAFALAILTQRQLRTASSR
jgi:hypothetical protein